MSAETYELLKEEDIAGPANPILANYILWRILDEKGSPVASEFGDKLLAHIEESIVSDSAAAIVRSVKRGS